MKIQIEQTKLAALLDQVVAMAPKTDLVPIWSHVRLEAKKKRLYATASDGNIWVTAYAPAKEIAEENGSTCVPGAALKGFIGALSKGGVVELVKSPDKEGLKVRCGKTSGSFGGLPAADFPVFTATQGDKAKSVEIECSDLRVLLGRTLPFVSDGDVRTYLNGVHLYGKADTLIAEGARSAAMSRQTAKATGTSGVNCILSKETSTTILRLLPEKGTATVLFDPAMIHVEVGEVSVMSRLVDQEYPNIDNLFPSEHKTVVRVDAESFLGMLRPIMSLTDTTHNGIRLTFNGSIAVSGAGQAHSADAEIDADIDGPEVKWSVNSKELKLALEQIGDTAVLKMEPERFIVVITAEGRDDWVSIISGLRF